MRRGGTRGLLATILAAGLLLGLATAAAAQVQPPGTNDAGGFRNVLPGGQGETVNAVELAAFLGPNGDRPASFTNQLGLYNDLIYAAPGLQPSDLDKYFKTAGFGLAQGDIGSTLNPRPGATIIRDKTYSVPKVYGTTRGDTMFGAGYASAQDRMFLMDVLRHTGRARLSELIGPGENDSTIQMDADQLKIADYDEDELQRMIDEGAARAGAEGQLLKNDLEEYTAGINKYIEEARTDPSKMPGEYAALGRQLEDWKQTDTVAIASLIGGIFGRGGGEEARVGEALREAQNALGTGPGRQVFNDFRRREDPEAPVTTTKSFPFDDPGPVDEASVAAPTQGSVQSRDPRKQQDFPPIELPELPISANAQGGWLQELQRRGMVFPRQNSNALLVGASHSATGRPLAVMGPQVGYYSPQILMEMELHGPDGLDVRGATFPGISLYVLLGRGRDFAWSATTATTDVVDEFAEELCDPDAGGSKTIDDGYLYKGNCVEFYTRDHNLTFLPIPSDPGVPHPPETLEVKRSVHGPIQGTAMVNGKKVAIAEARSTYFHELDSALAFKGLNNNEVSDAASFQQNMNEINFAFNWFYADDQDIAFLQSGWYPRRATGTDPDQMAWGTGQWDWKGFNGDVDYANVQGDLFSSERLPFESLPKDANPPQGYLVNWNNKQAPGWRSADDNWVFSSVHRSQRLEDRLKEALAGGNKLSLTGLTQIMELGATTDLRGWRIYPLLERMIRAGATDAETEELLGVLDSWRANGAHRRDMLPAGNPDNNYDEGPAVALMDAWWPKLVEGMFEPELGSATLERFKRLASFDQPANPGGSAYFTGWWGYIDKELRTLLNDPVSQPLSRRYCGSPQNTLSACRDVIIQTLKDAAAEEKQSQGDKPIDQWERPRDQIEFTVAGGVDTPAIHWQDRPTFQQVVSIGAPLGGASSAGTLTLSELQGGGNAAGTAGAGCVGRSLALGSRGFGPLRIGMTRQQVLAALGVPQSFSASSLRYCLTGGQDLRIVFSSSSSSRAAQRRTARVRLIALTGRGSLARGVRRGSRKFKRALRIRRRITRTLYASRGSRPTVVGTRRGRVRFVAKTERRALRRKGRQLRRYLRQARL